ncbi:UNVERIFIED_CONTAM: hypothetical protein HDU68_002414 [Siphonaria sp. JEL0065]|nr:hypothetical protein HDU68_002414 [Siphonaria sp. JEL0065]
MTAFGQTNWDGSDFGYYANEFPVFYGGSTQPPPDGSFTLTELVVTQGWIGKLLYFYLASGAIFIVVCHVFTIRYKRKGIVKRLSLQVLGACLFGCVFLIAGVGAFLVPTVGTCKARVWLPAIGYSLISSALIAKMRMSYILVMRGQKVRSFSLLEQVVAPIVAACGIQSVGIFLTICFLV